jgi:uncharacterized protein
MGFSDQQRGLTRMITTLCDRLGTLCVTWPRQVLAVCVVLTLLTIPLVVHLHLEADVRATLPADMAQTLERHQTLFGTADLAFLLVRTTQARKEDLVAFGTALQQRLTATPLIRSVAFGSSPTLLAALDHVTLAYAPLFVRAADLDDFDRLLTPEGLRTQIQKTLLTLSLPGTGLHEQWLLTDPLQLRRFALARLTALRGTFRFDPTSPHWLSQDGTALLIKVEGRASVHDPMGVKATVSLLQRAIADVVALPAFQGLTVQATGGYFFAAESERIIRSDMIWNLNLSVLLICLLLTWAFRRWGVLLYGQIPTLLGLFLALGTFALVRPKLNALTLGCAAGLVGLGVDYTIHILTQCFAALSTGTPKRRALRTAVRETGGGLMGAALTTVVGFGAFILAGQPFLQDTGLLATLGIMWCCALCVTFLPALLMCLPTSQRRPAPRALGLPLLLTHTLRAATLVLGFSLTLCLGALAALVWWPPGFDTDLRNIHAKASPTLQVQAHIATLFGGSQEPLMLMLEGTTEDHVLHDMQRLEPALMALVEDGLLAAVTSPSLFYPDPYVQTEVLQRLHTKDPDALLQMVKTSLVEAGFDLTALQGYLDQVAHALRLQVPLDLATFTSLGFGELLRPLLAHDETGAVAQALLFPTKELWTQADRDSLSQRLTAELTARGLRGSLTGLYTVSSASAVQIAADFRRITLVAAIGVMGIVCLQFRSLLLVSLVLLPVGCGALWTAGVWALLGWKLNVMNIGILPMLLGIGIDYGIYIVHRVRIQGTLNVHQAVHDTGTAITLSAVTTQVGFGTLALSTNQGLASVGLVVLVGITACLVASLCTLPAALQVWLTGHTRLTQG